ncbi:MAG: fused MFS/spermidine synthase [Gemmatimonadales bacterium]|nr:fused MFS/spermidine synthase [Gemmatimonadales bacterium]
MTRLLYLLFTLSGAAGLVYESTWTRYLGLLVGHSAYAQVLVLVIFLGGLSLGAWLAGRRAEALARPLLAYAVVEALTGVIGLAFHDVFVAASGWATTSLFPAAGSPAALAASRWGLAALLILPQSVLLGTTFPLMSSAVVRREPEQPGRVLALLYFTNSLGAAAGVLLAGFVLVELAGLPGTLAAAAIANLVVAGGAVLVDGPAGQRAGGAAGSTEPPPAPRGEGSPGLRPAVPPAALLATALLTGLASFTYEIAWIRMLALLFGSATHAFELMLSAFILGLALGAWWVHRRADRLADPLRTLATIQLAMGALALATLPLYVAGFDGMALLLRTLQRSDAGWVAFNLARYGFALAVMLPATTCAGMTLPLLTRALYTGGAGERAIGATYAVNTLGSIAGAALAGLVLLPLLGLKGLLAAGATLDMAVGLALLVAAGAAGPALAASAGAVALVALALVAVRLDPLRLGSGVFRTGAFADTAITRSLYMADGRTATVTATRNTRSAFVSLSTNGKPDASLRDAWKAPCTAGAPRLPFGADEPAQTLLPLVTLAHRPDARRAALVGWGSGMSSHVLLASPALERLETIEIEPRMLDGARVFFPANRRAYEDPRSAVVIDDARSHFAAGGRAWDLVMSEPSNPWVSGVSGLFTTEFYAGARRALAPGGVFGQWMQFYEMDDTLILHVLAALDANFPHWRVYLLSGGDLLIVAANEPLRAPDWSVAQLPALQGQLCHFLPLVPEELGQLHLVDAEALRPLLGTIPPNSDFYPRLDLGAERRRFLRSYASGVEGLSSQWFGLLRARAGVPEPAGGTAPAALPENPRVRARMLGAAARRARAGVVLDTVIPVLARQAAQRLQLFDALLATPRPPADWAAFLALAADADGVLGAGTAGVPLPETPLRYAERHGAPLVVRDILRFRRAVAAWDWATAAGLADALAAGGAPPIRAGLVAAEEVLDGGVVAHLQRADTAGAARLHRALRPLVKRSPADLRSQLLVAWIEGGPEGRGAGGQGERRERRLP